MAGTMEPWKGTVELTGISTTETSKQRTNTSNGHTKERTPLYNDNDIVLIGVRYNKILR